MVSSKIAKPLEQFGDGFQHGLEIAGKLKHRGKAFGHLFREDKEASIENRGSRLQPLQRPMSYSSTDCRQFCQAGHTYADQAAKNDVGGIVNSQVNSRDSKSARDVHEEKDTRASRDKQNGNGKTEPQRSVITREGVPAQQPPREHVVGQLKMEQGVSQRSLAEGERERQRARAENRHKGAQDAKQNKFPIFGAVFPLLEPGPPEEHHDWRGREGIGIHEKKESVESPGAMSKTIEERNDVIVEGIYCLPQAGRKQAHQHVAGEQKAEKCQQAAQEHESDV